MHVGFAFTQDDPSKSIPLLSTRIASILVPETPSSFLFTTRTSMDASFG
jgi:hypothetical protein